MSRVINFSPGPATLPTSVLEEVRDELLDFQGSGISMLEHSHRGAHYSAVHTEATALVRELLAVPETHDILWMQGGATGQFAIAPMNLLQGGAADYVNTGAWSKKAFAAAKSYGAPKWIATGEEDGMFTHAPTELPESDGAKYVHLTSNATIAGVQYHDFPETKAPLIADMSSDILWRPIDVSKFGLIYAGAQKNLGPAGITLVIASKELIAQGASDIPDIFKYGFIAKNNSLQNTIPTFPVYVVGKVLKWVKANGGAAGMEQRNRKKAEDLYGVIDGNCTFYTCPVAADSRSVMNVVFRLPTEELEKTFIADAAEAGMVNLKGHRSVGGIRVSMYNAMEPENVAKLCEFMTDFAKKHG